MRPWSFRLFFRIRTTLCSRIKKHSMAPVVMLCHQGSRRPEVVTMDLLVLRVSTPKKVPITLPTPPVSSVPPMMEEAMAFISAAVAFVALPAPVCIINTKPAIPLRMPQSRWAMKRE